METLGVLTSAFISIVDTVELNSSPDSDFIKISHDNNPRKR